MARASLASSSCRATLKPAILGSGQSSSRLDKAEFVSRILQHLRLPLSPQSLSDEAAVVCDVTFEPMPPWVVGTDPEPNCTSGAKYSEVHEHGEAARSEPEPDERAPPSDWDGVDTPAPDD